MAAQAIDWYRMSQSLPVLHTAGYSPDNRVAAWHAQHFVRAVPVSLTQYVMHTEQEDLWVQCQAVNIADETSA